MGIITKYVNTSELLCFGFATILVIALLYAIIRAIRNKFLKALLLAITAILVVVLIAGLFVNPIKRMSSIDWAQKCSWTSGKDSIEISDIVLSDNAERIIVEMISGSKSIRRNVTKGWIELDYYELSVDNTYKLTVGIDSLNQQPMIICRRRKYIKRLGTEVQDAEWIILPSEDEYNMIKSLLTVNY